MALNKQPININFTQGLDTKSDPHQVPIGKFLALSNTIFDKIGRLTKRNGYGQLMSLPDSSATYATTFSGGLLALGDTLQALSESSNTWVNKGAMTELSLSVQPLVRSAISQTQADSTAAANGLLCTAFTEFSGSANSFKYTITDSTTGAVIISPTVLVPTSGAASGAPKVFLLGNYFVVVFTATITAAKHLQYIAISTADPTVVSAATNITSTYTSSTKGSWDGVVANNNLYIAWNGSDVGGAIRLTYLDSTLIQHNTVIFATESCEIMSVCADTSGSSTTVYAAYYDSTGTTGKVLAADSQLSTILAPTQWIAAGVVDNVTSLATAGVVTIYYELEAVYSYDSLLPTNILKSRTCTQAGVLGSVLTIARGVGLASKVFSVGSSRYVLASYSSAYQPSYFLLNAATGSVVAKLAYSNGGGYLGLGLPSVTVAGTVASIPYLFKDLIVPINKTQGAANSTGVYAQTGINLATFSFGTDKVVSSEIGGGLHLSGGLLWFYDGTTPVEHGFNLWPDSVEVSTATTGGFLSDQEYFYQVTYEWTDSAGNIHRSAPSIPVSVTTAGGGTSSNTIHVPTLRLTYKTVNKVRIVIYRWSVSQETYYQVTDFLSPLLNDPTVDSVQFVDTLADASIIGNSILYTTGGVVENIAAPTPTDITLFKSRLILLDAEDPNLLWYSKQVIEATPVELSDLFTIYTAPTTGAQGSTGPNKCAWPMDDKLIISKKDALYYIVGSGPDNTGANDDFSDAVYISGTVGCENKKSVILIPSGTMFQSDKGIWLLGRDLSTSYIGNPVEAFTQDATVLSAITVPGTNQVRFTMDSGVTLMYDYFYDQWAVFLNVPAVSSTIYLGLHTYINSLGQVFQETPGRYLDGSKPVLVSFKTAWINLAGLQGYERFYFMFLLGQYLSPFKLNVEIAYDYNSNPSQSILITPDNYSPAYGGDPLYGNGSPYGGPGKVFESRVFPQQQKCESFQITMTEIYDSSLGVQAGAGLTLSGLNLIVGVKKGYRVQQSSRSFG